MATAAGMITSIKAVPRFAKACSVSITTSQRSASKQRRFSKTLLQQICSNCRRMGAPADYRVPQHAERPSERP